MVKPAFDAIQVRVEVPEEFVPSLLSDDGLVSVSDSLLEEPAALDTNDIVIRPISHGKMEEIARSVCDEVHMLPYRIIQESLLHPRLSADQIRALDSRVIDFIFAEIYKINGFQCTR